MRLLVLQHHPDEHPGIFRDFLAADGIAWEAVELDAGETIPPLAGYDALWSFGGPMDVWQTDQHPWIEDEKAVIREAVRERRMPFLGVCLGHQLLAEALGGKVGPMDRGEIGVLAIEPTEAGVADGFFASAAPLAALQWHSAEVKTAPPDSTVLASSPVSAVQALRCGQRAYGIQYHVEVTADTVTNWGCIPEYKAALERAAGAQALAEFKAAADANMAGFHQNARRLYEGFKVLVTRQSD